MLSFINQKGPFTQGIFGKSASIKSCRALKKKLNCGDTVNLKDEPILVIAWVLKVRKVWALSTHGKSEATWLILHYECPRTLIGIREEGSEKWKTLHKAKTEGRYLKCYKPHTLDIFLFHCTSWLRNTPCKGITIYFKIPTYTLSVYQNKLPALDDFLITFLMKATFPKENSY